MLDFRKSFINATLRKVLKRLHYPLEVMLTCVRWYMAYPLSLQHVEEMMQERGVFVDHSTVHRTGIKMLPVLHMIRKGQMNCTEGSAMSVAQQFYGLAV
jgi:putative transposase